MDQAALPARVGDSQSESVGSSLSLVESVGSLESWKLRATPTKNRVDIVRVDTEGWKLRATPTRTPKVRVPRRGKKSNPERQFIHFSKVLRDVPVQVVWDMISNHKNTAPLMPGITESFDYIEGDGGVGSIYVAMYSQECVRPGERKYQMNKVQVRDEASKLFAVKSMGGKYQQRYNFFTQYIQVHADEVLGARSSVVECHFEFELRNKSSPPPVDSRSHYIFLMSSVKDRYQDMNRVERPVTVVINITKRLRLHAGQRLLPGADEREPEDRLHRRRRKPTIQITLIEDDDQHRQIQKNDPRAQIQEDEQRSQNLDEGQQSPIHVSDEEGNDQESQKKKMPGKETSYHHQLAGRGLVFRRTRPR